MAEALRVEAPNEALARALMRRLNAMPTELHSDESSVEVKVELTGNVDRAIVDVLHALDGWLLENKVTSIRIHLNGRMYTVSPPPHDGR
jgi:hypothetical protein